MAMRNGRIDCFDAAMGMSLIASSPVRSRVQGGDLVSCEVCGSVTEILRLPDGSELQTCTKCSHIERDIGAAPANHRDMAYGGDPGLDRIRLSLTWRELVDAAPLEPGSRVFEIGFGAGALLARFGESGHTVGGCDPDQLKVAVDPRVQNDGLVYASGVEQVVHEGERFELVYGVHVIEHVADVEQTLVSARRLLKPGGRLVLVTPGADSLSRKFFKNAWWLLEDPTHIRFFSKRSLKTALDDAGFVDVRIQRALLDNLTMEGASIIRAVNHKRRPEGVLANPWARRFATCIAPLAVLLRAVIPSWRPTLVAVASLPGDADGN